MRKVLGAYLCAVLFALCGCVSTGLDKFYTLDMRSAKVPVMLNKGAAGREITAIASQSAAGTQIQYEDTDAYGTWNVTETITFTEKTRLPLHKQLLSQLNPGDTLIRLHQIDFSFHNLLIPYYGESEMFQKVVASVYGRGTKK